MLYSVKGEAIDEINAGKTIQQTTAWIEGVVAPSIEALEKAIQSKNIAGGHVAGAREVFFVLDAPSNEEVSEFLRSMPFGNALKWTVISPQSPRSAHEQSKTMIQRARAMLSEQLQHKL